MGVQILNKDVSIISSIGGIAKASIGSVGGVTGWGGGSDVIPDAVNWTNITGEGVGQTNNQTIAGINVPITLRIESDYNGIGSSNIYVNGVVDQMADEFDTYGFYNQIVNNGDIIYFERVAFGGVSETVTVKNSSDGNVVLDTFTISLTGGGG